MKISIDNLDGLGALDYSAWVSASGPLKVVRTLNAPTTCTCTLDLRRSSLNRPERRARAVVTSADGTVLFTGYVATAPEMVFAGLGIDGPVYLSVLSLVSDEWLLDRQAASVSGAWMAQTGGAALATLTGRTEGGLLSTSNLGTGRSIGIFQPQPTKSWSANAGALADAVYGSYRTLAGTLDLLPVGASRHVLSDADGRIDPGALAFGKGRQMANDITVSGEREPTTFVTEVFSGDGTTSLFESSQAPFTKSSATNGGRLLTDSFDADAIDDRIWKVSDPGSHLRLTSAGFTMNGGNGQEGQTTLQGIDGVEIGGTLLLEAGSVQLGPGSDGVLCGFYNGPATRSGCFAGFDVRQSNGTTVIQPLVNGIASGISMTMLNGHRYVLRVRVHCLELNRVKQIYYAMAAGTVRSFGGGVVESGADLVMDVQDLGAAANTPATVLFDGSVATSPAMCNLVPVNSLQLFGSIGYCTLTQGGTAWVTSTVPQGKKRTRLIGLAGEGVDCTLTPAGRVNFMPGRVPVPGELVTLSYRTGQRSIARMEDPQGVAYEQATGVPGTARWLGRVVIPAARTSSDCECAAMALLTAASDDTAASGGRYEVVNGPDLWPGDLLMITRGGEQTNAIAKRVTLEDGMSAPESIGSRVEFADTWADGLGLKVSDAIATDTTLPRSASSAPGAYPDSLPRLSIAGVSATALQIDAGEDAPAGGGFEVRRRDGAFGPGVDQDLVLRSPVRGLTIPREAQVERYFVRMYDGSTPPLYSRFSSGIFVDVPVA